MWRVDDLDERRIDPELDPIREAVIESEIGRVLSLSGKGRFLQPVMLVKELDVELSLRRSVGIIGVKWNLTRSRRRKEDEGKDQEYEFKCAGEPEHDPIIVEIRRRFQLTSA